MPTIPSVPTIQVPSLDKARTTLTDVAYVGVGAAVLTAQRVQVARKDVQELLEDGFAKLINVRPAEVRTEISERIDTLAEAGRKAFRKEDAKPAAKTSTKAVSSKAAA
ncbi:MAG TPA: hypothetical protein VMY88_00975 [Acidimicrobiales bacterium]|nr:hypothetical protein [Acidimicrobiales bacterium]